MHSADRVIFFADFFFFVFFNGRTHCVMKTFESQSLFSVCIYINLHETSGEKRNVEIIIITQCSTMYAAIGNSKMHLLASGSFEIRFRAICISD